jgi:group I intron endonuclease
MAQSGVYSITNCLTGKLYVGSALDMERRWRVHLRLLRVGRHHNAKLQNAWVKYGAAAFVFEILEIVADQTTLLTREQFHIDARRAVEAGYNIAPRAGSQLGLRHSQTSRQKMREAKLGRRLPRETCQKIAEGGRRRFANPVEREKQSRRLAARPCSTETRARIADSNRGKVRTPEQVEHNRILRTGHRHSDETRERMRAAHSAKAADPAFRARLSAAKVGNKCSLGHKQTAEHVWKRMEAARRTRDARRLTGGHFNG